MQFGHALERILCEFFLANPDHGHDQINKTVLSVSFYPVDRKTNEVPKIGVVLPNKLGTEAMIVSTLVFTMGWKNSPPAFSTSTETVDDFAKKRLSCPEYQLPDHRLDQMAT